MVEEKDKKYTMLYRMTMARAREAKRGRATDREKEKRKETETHCKKNCLTNIYVQHVSDKINNGSQLSANKWSNAGFVTSLSGFPR